MPRALIPILAASLTLTACSGSGPAGVIRPPVPTEARIPCRAPAEFLAAGDWELIAGRMGDELVRCEGRRALAVGAPQSG